MEKVRLYQTSWGMLVDLNSIAAITEVHDLWLFFTVSWKAGGCLRVSWEDFWEQHWYKHRFECSGLTLIEQMETLRQELIKQWKDEK